MLRNYSVVALRGLLRDSGYTTINILGLAIGMACCLVVASFVHHETSYDRQHSKADRIHRVLRETRDAGGEGRFSSGTSGPLAAVMQAEIPEVEQTARMWHHWISVKSEDRHLYRTVAIVDPTFFDLFDYEMLTGSIEALVAPGTALLYEDTAVALFGDEDPLGRMLRIDGDHGGGDVRVVGVVRDPGIPSTVQFQVVMTHRLPGDLDLHWEEWIEHSWRQVRTYVLLKEGTDAAPVGAKLRPMLERFLGPEVAKTNFYHLQALPRTHLYSGVDFGIRSDRDIDQVYTYALTALLVLLIACINFVNLSTARSSRRRQEIAVRTAAGARRQQLLIQVLGESILLALLAYGVACVTSSIAQEPFNDLVGISLEPAWELVPYGIPAAIVVGVLAGLYPAFILTHRAPAPMLRGGSEKVRRASLRRGLVVLQFAASVLFVIIAYTIRDQLHYVQSRPLGFDEDHVANLWMTNRKPELYQQIESIKSMLLEHPNVLSATGEHGWGMIKPAQVDIHEVGHEQEFAFHRIETDPDFVDTYRIPIVLGRNIRIDTDEALVNERAVQALGWDDPIGRQIEWVGERGPLTVVGVVADFHFQSMHMAITPVVVHPMWFASHLAVRIAPYDVPATLDHLQEVWMQVAPEHPFSYHFLDESIADAYDADRQAVRIATASAAMASFVACLGLLGLVSFSAERRRREISIRKLLGATSAGVVALLSREFLVLVALGNLLAWPAAYLLARRWLDAFVYRIELGPQMFAITGLTTIILALVTVAAQTLRAAHADPVEALRDQ